MIKKSKKKLSSNEDAPIPNKKIKLEGIKKDTEIPEKGHEKIKKAAHKKTFSKSDKIKQIRTTEQTSEIKETKKKLNGKSNQDSRKTAKENPIKKVIKFKKSASHKGGVKANKADKNVKTDWNEFKKKKKEVQLKRKQSNKLYDVITKVKQVGEKLRCKSLKGGEAERSRLCLEIHELIGNQGNYPKFVMAHDTARVIQSLLKFGSPIIKQEVAKELIPVTVQMLTSKYAKNCVKAMLKYGNTQTRSATIQSFYGNVVKLCGYVLSTQIFEFAYSTFATAQEKQFMAQEFYGDIYKQSKDNDVHYLKDVFEKSPDMKVAALGATKANLVNILNKHLLDNGLVHTILYQYMQECGSDERVELVTQLASHVVILSNTKDGVRVAMQCFWIGSNKDRKIAIKSLKEHVIELSQHEHGHNLIITLLDTIDDTVVINKIILTELMANVQQVAQNDWGRKILLWLLAPGNSKYFHPTFLSELEISHKISTSKKSVDIRRKELLNFVKNSLLDNVANDATFWLHDASVAIVTLNIIATGDGKLLTNALNAIAVVITQLDWKIQDKVKEGENPKVISGIEHSGLHMVLKNLAKNDKEAVKKGLDTFGAAVVQNLSKEVVENWISSNRGCFLFVNIIENVPDLQEKIKEMLMSYVQKIKKANNAGAKLLLKKLEL